jgi:hypothetical protein
MSRPFVAVDLDQTLIFSAGAAVSADEAQRVVVEISAGEPVSWMSRPAAALFEELTRMADVVPVTTRSVEQAARVSLPGRTPFALVANGAELMVGGTGGVRDPQHAAWAATLFGSSAPLADAHAQLTLVAGEPWCRGVRSVADAFCYLVAESRAVMPAPWLAGVGEWADESGWRLSVQGRKAYLLPAPLTKAAGIRRLMTVLDGEGAARPLFAAGDSLLDLDLLIDADFAVRPPHGELAEQEGISPEILVATGYGILAGEDVVRLLLGAVRTWHARAEAQTPGARWTAGRHD